MERVNQRNCQPIKPEDIDEILMVRLPPDLVTKSDREIEEFHQRLLSLPEGEQKSTALRRFKFFMKQQQKLLDSNGGRLPFAESP